MCVSLLLPLLPAAPLLFCSGDDESGVLAVDRGLHYAATAATGGAGAASAAASAATGELTVEKVRPRKELPPLLVNAADIRRPERLHWLGVSYGLTLQLFNFWRRGGYLPAYLRQTANDLTAEHTMIMMKPLDCSDMTAGTAPKPGWFAGFVAGASPLAVAPASVRSSCCVPPPLPHFITSQCYRLDCLFSRCRLRAPVHVAALVRVPHL